MKYVNLSEGKYVDIDERHCSRIERERAHILTNCTHQPSLRHTSVQIKGCGEERKTHENFFRDSSTNMYRLFSFNILYETQCKKTLHHEIRFHTKCLSLFLSII